MKIIKLLLNVNLIKMRIYICMFFLALLITGTAVAQVGINTENPHVNSDLELGSNNKALLLNRVNNVTSIGTAVNGMIVYDLSLQCVRVFQKGAWSNCLSDCACPAADDPSTNGTGVVSAYNCSGPLSGSLTVGTAVTGVTKTITANVTTPGTYNISTTANGVTFSGTGTFTSTGNQQIVLTATGTPTSAGTFNHVINTTPNCNFDVTSNSPEGVILGLNCGNGATHNGTLYSSISANNVSSVFTYTGGNGGAYPAQSIASTGVTGLTATLASGTFANGSGSITYTISGTPSGSGVAQFAITVGGQGPCTWGREVVAVAANACNPSNPTMVVELTAPSGRTWMDRNLGASRQAINDNDDQAKGNLYQWGRLGDGHQCVNRFAGDGVTTSLQINGKSDNPDHDRFIVGAIDWRVNDDLNLWLNGGPNNPCPTGYRVPTRAEFENEIDVQGGGGHGNGFNALRITKAGYRNAINGNLIDTNTSSWIWTNTPVLTNMKAIQDFTKNNGNSNKAMGFSVRCIKN